MNRCRGTVLEALLMSMATSRDLLADFRELRPSSIVCMRFVRWVDVECCEGDKLMCGVMMFRTSLSNILELLQKSDMGL